MNYIVHGNCKIGTIKQASDRQHSAPKKVLYHSPLMGIRVGIDVDYVGTMSA